MVSSLPPRKQSRLFACRHQQKTQLSLSFLLVTPGGVEPPLQA